MLTAQRFECILDFRSIEAWLSSLRCLLFSGPECPTLADDSYLAHHLSLGLMPLGTYNSHREEFVAS